MFDLKKYKNIYMIGIGGIIYYLIGDLMLVVAIMKVIV